uniref:C2H2-type domain-containing protein n=1 Tax=Rhabditophanes sp. KR3021 TaxID=114890 RepID=A0AC35U480_9BILA
MQPRKKKCKKANKSNIPLPMESDSLGIHKPAPKERDTDNNFSSRISANRNQIQPPLETTNSEIQYSRHRITSRTVNAEEQSISQTDQFHFQHPIINSAYLLHPQHPMENLGHQFSSQHPMANNQAQGNPQMANPSNYFYLQNHLQHQNHIQHSMANILNLSHLQNQAQNEPQNQPQSQPQNQAQNEPQNQPQSQPQNQLYSQYLPQSNRHNQFQHQTQSHHPMTNEHPPNPYANSSMTNENNERYYILNTVQIVSEFVDYGSHSPNQDDIIIEEMGSEENKSDRDKKSENNENDSGEESESNQNDNDEGSENNETPPQIEEGKENETPSSDEEGDSTYLYTNEMERNQTSSFEEDSDSQILNFAANEYEDLDYVNVRRQEMEGSETHNPSPCQINYEQTNFVEHQETNSAEKQQTDSVEKEKYTDDDNQTSASEGQKHPGNQVLSSSEPNDCYGYIPTIEIMDCAKNDAYCPIKMIGTHIHSPPLNEREFVNNHDPSIAYDQFSFDQTPSLTSSDEQEYSLNQAFSEERVDYFNQNTLSKEHEDLNYLTALSQIVYLTKTENINDGFHYPSQIAGNQTPSNKSKQSQDNQSLLINSSERCINPFLNLLGIGENITSPPNSLNNCITINYDDRQQSQMLSQQKLSKDFSKNNIHTVVTPVGMLRANDIEIDAVYDNIAPSHIYAQKIQTDSAAMIAGTLTQHVNGTKVSKPSGTSLINGNTFITIPFTPESVNNIKGFNHSGLSLAQMANSINGIVNQKSNSTSNTTSASSSSTNGLHVLSQTALQASNCDKHQIFNKQPFFDICTQLSQALTPPQESKNVSPVHFNRVSENKKLKVTVKEEGSLIRSTTEDMPKICQSNSVSPSLSTDSSWYVKREDNCVSKQHKYSHSKEKTQHSCSVCSKKFQFKSNLREHMAVHQEGAQYQCPICDKTCRLKGNLKKHFRTHTVSNAELEKMWEKFKMSMNSRSGPKPLERQGFADMLDKITFQSLDEYEDSAKSKESESNTNHLMDTMDLSDLPVLTRAVSTTKEIRSRSPTPLLRPVAIAPVKNVQVETPVKVMHPVNNNICKSIDLRTVFNLKEPTIIEYFNCAFCSEKFTSRNMCTQHSYQEHFDLVQSSKNASTWCAVCLRHFPAHEQLQQHLGFHEIARKMAGPDIMYQQTQH